MNLGDLLLAMYAQQSARPQVSPWLDPRYFTGGPGPQPTTPVIPPPPGADQMPSREMQPGMPTFDALSALRNPATAYAILGGRMPPVRVTR